MSHSPGTFRAVTMTPVTSTTLGFTTDMPILDTAHMVTQLPIMCQPVTPHRSMEDLHSCSPLLSPTLTTLLSTSCGCMSTMIYHQITFTLSKSMLNLVRENISILGNTSDDPYPHTHASQHMSAATE